MKQIIKNPLFTFVLGAFLFSGVTYAATVLASNVTYDNTVSGINANNVQDAIDSLYTKANNPTIPANYKELSTVTTATSSDILNGKTAYNNDGELLTGSFSLTTKGTEWNSGTIIMNASTSESINLGFNPNLVLFTNRTNGSCVIFNANFNSNKQFINGNEYSFDRGSSTGIVSISNNTVTFYSAYDLTWDWVAIH